MANVSIVVGLFFLIFAIMGVQLFGGRFWSCNDTSVANKVDRAFFVHLVLLPSAGLWHGFGVCADMICVSCVAPTAWLLADSIFCAC